MCLNPQYMHNKGKYLETTYKGEKGTPYDIEVYAKCGNCIQCTNEKSNNWVIRNRYEAKAHNKICFITLTYAESPYFLIRKHLQDFIKRLRRELERKEKIKIRIFYNGEYGEKNNRPHYHVIIYGWEEKQEKLKYKRLNKKNNIIYESETINKLWKHGIHAYQIFNKKEINYIALYNTARESEKRDYIISIENTKKLLKELKKKEQTHVHRFYMIQLLNKEIKKRENRKNKYICIKEFNGWSKALGWEQFYKEYQKNKETYDFKEYLENKEFLTPSPWVIKLANKGDKRAINEMLSRSAELATNLTVEELKSKNLARLMTKRKNEIFKYIEDDQKKEF